MGNEKSQSFPSCLVDMQQKASSEYLKAVARIKNEACYYDYYDYLPDQVSIWVARYMHVCMYIKSGE